MYALQKAGCPRRSGDTYMTSRSPMSLIDLTTHHSSVQLTKHANPLCFVAGKQVFRTTRGSGSAENKFEKGMRRGQLGVVQRTRSRHSQSGVVVQRASSRRNEARSIDRVVAACLPHEVICEKLSCVQRCPYPKRSPNRHGVLLTLPLPPSPCHLLVVMTLGSIPRRKGTRTLTLVCRPWPQPSKDAGD